MPEPAVPPGYTTRPPALEEVGPALALLNHCDRPHAGCDWHSPTVLRGFWTHPDLDMARDVRLVLDGDRAIVGYVQVWTAPPHVQTRVFGRVHPDHRGRGIGSALLAWGEDLGRRRLPEAPPDALVQMLSWTIDGQDAAAALLLDHGLVLDRHSLNMAVSLAEPPAAPRWPPGLELRPFDRGLMRAFFGARREAFRDHYGMVEREFESDYARFMHWVKTDPRWDAELIFVAWDGDEIAGALEGWAESDEDPEMGWVAQMWVRRPWRRRGLATALMLHAFARFRALGRTRAGLGVDAQSLTGATALYEKVGMSAYRVFNEYAKVLRPGREMGTTESGQ